MAVGLTEYSSVRPAAPLVHYVDNDPLNKTDPLGLRAQDCNFSQDGTCPVVVNDVDPGRRVATVSFTVPERDRNDCYTPWHSAAYIANYSNQYGFDPSMVWGIYAQETTACRTANDDWLAWHAWNLGRNDDANFGPANIQLQAVIEVMNANPGLFGFNSMADIQRSDAVRTWHGLANGNEFSSMEMSARITVLWLKELNRRLDEAIGAKNVKQVGTVEEAKNLDGDDWRIYRRSALLGVGWFRNTEKYFANGTNWYVTLFERGISAIPKDGPRPDENGFNTYTGAKGSYCSEGVFVC